MYLAASDPTPPAVLGLLVIAAAASTVAAAFLVHRATRSASLLTPAYVFLVYYVVFVLIGGVNLVLDQGAGSYFNYPGTRNYVFLFSIVAGVLAFAGGVLAANRLHHLRPRTELARFHARPLLDSIRGPAANLLFAALAALSVLVAGFVFLFATSALRFLLLHLGTTSTGIDIGLHDARLAGISANAGGLPFQALLYQFYGNLLPLLGVLALAWAVVRRDRRWLIAGMGSLAIATLLAADSLAKAPVIGLMLFLFLAWQNFAERRLRPSVLAGVGVGAAVLFVGIVEITNRSVALPIVLWSSARRLLLVQAEVLYSLFELIPSKVGFQHGGALWMDLRNLKPGPKSTLDFGGWLYNQIVPNHPELYGIGSAPTAFIGQLYADLGVPAALLGMFVVGYACQWIYIRHLRAPKTIVNWLVFVGLTAAIPRLATSSLVAIVFEYGIAACILLGVYFVWGQRLLEFRRAGTPPPVAEPAAARRPESG